MAKRTNRVVWGLAGVLAVGVLAGGWGDNPRVRAFSDRPIQVLRPRQHIRVLTVALSPDSSLLATAGYDRESTGGVHSVYLWDLHTGRLHRTLTGHRSGVSSLAFSPTGNVVASGSYDKTLKLWDTHTGELKRALVGQCGHVQSIAFSPDGRTVASAEETAVNLWDVQTGKLTRQMKGEADEQLLSAAFSPNGRFLATGSLFGVLGGAGDAILWDVQTGRLLRRFTGCSGAVWSVAFSPHGTVLASEAGGGKTSPEFTVGVSLWDVSTGRLRATVPGGHRRMDPLAFAFDGKTLVSGGETIQMWDSSTGGLQRTIRGGKYGYNSLALSADGKTLAAACDGDPVVKIWRLR
jgi:WD40 repeat protein